MTEKSKITGRVPGNAASKRETRSLAGACLSSGAKESEEIVIWMRRLGNLQLA
jgi:hypothetical protein